MGWGPGLNEKEKGNWIPTDSHYSLILGCAHNGAKWPIFPPLCLLQREGVYPQTLGQINPFFLILPLPGYFKTATR